jgi:Trk K+ transport system NAD-binding subunit
MCVLALVSLVWGYVGFRDLTAAQGLDRSPLTLLYLTLQLFVLESGAVGGPVPWYLDVARFIAPIVPAWALVQALGVIFRDQLRAVCLSRSSGHTVICGLGQRGMQLVRDFSSEGDKVVVIEGDEANDEIRVCEELGATVVVGNAEDPALLTTVGAAHARHIVAVCSDDGTNVEIATSAHALVEGLPEEAAVRCLVHMVDLRLCDLLNRHRMFRDTADAFTARIFSVYDNTARMLWQEHMLERDLTGPEDSRNVHLLVVGLGQMGESVLLQAVRMGHFANGRPLRVTVVDRQAGKRRTGLLQRYPNLEQACDVQFVEADVEGPGFLTEAAEWTGGPDTITTVAVCFDDDSASFACALNMAEQLEDESVPILVRLSSDGGLASLLQNGTGGDVAGRLHAFGAISRSCARDVLLDEKLDIFARAIHEDYIANRQREGTYEAANPAHFAWDRLDEGFRDSNRQQADHIPVKLRTIGCYSAAGETGKEPVDEFTDEEVELLSKMEHARWNAERLLAGWVYGPERDNRRKVHPWIVSWAELPEEIREYDREAVRNIPHLLSLIAEQVYRGEASGAPSADRDKESA